MNKQDKIDKIYKEIANKEIGFGCLLKANIQTENMGDSNATVKYYGEIKSELPGGHMIKVMYGNSKFAILTHLTKTIGHPVLIGDVLDYCFENGIEILGRIGDKGRQLLSLWTTTRKPIEEQSEECIDYVNNFLNNEEGDNPK